jgi:hypothetical protein
VVDRDGTDDTRALSKTTPPRFLDSSETAYNIGELRERTLYAAIMGEVSKHFRAREM